MKRLVRVGVFFETQLPCRNTFDVGLPLASNVEVLYLAWLENQREGGSSRINQRRRDAGTLRRAVLLHAVSARCVQFQLRRVLRQLFEGTVLLAILSEVDLLDVVVGGEALQVLYELVLTLRGFLQDEPQGTSNPTPHWRYRRINIRGTPLIRSGQRYLGNAADRFAFVECPCFVGKIS